MHPDPKKYGRTEIAPINVLEPVEVDFSAGPPMPPKLGQTEAPVNILPVLEIDLSEPAPALALTFRLRPGVSPAAVAVDLFAVWKALNEYELSVGGSGLKPGEARDEQTAGGTVIRLVLTPADPVGAADRLAQLAAAVNGATDPAALNGVLTGRSFEKCEAELRTAA